MSGRRATAYERDPEAIYRLSFARVRAETDLGQLPWEMHAIAIRLVHACAMPDIVADLAFSDGLLGRARAALAAGAVVIADCAMVAAGIDRARLPAANAVVCTLHEPEVPARARRLGTTRAAAAVDLWRAHMQGAVISIGNAPTALFRLLEVLAEGAPRPAAILAFPVGLVGAAEAKEALIADPGGIPFLALRGRRGGSALAAAAVNAIAGERNP